MSGVEKCRRLVDARMARRGVDDGFDAGADGGAGMMLFVVPGTREDGEVVAMMEGSKRSCVRFVYVCELCEVVLVGKGFAFDEAAGKYLCA